MYFAGPICSGIACWPLYFIYLFPLVATAIALISLFSKLISKQQTIVSVAASFAYVLLLKNPMLVQYLYYMTVLGLVFAISLQLFTFRKISSDFLLLIAVAWTWNILALLYSTAALIMVLIYIFVRMRKLLRQL